MVKSLVIFGVVWPALILVSILFAAKQEPLAAHFIGFTTAMVFMAHAYIDSSRNGAK